jgi:hypothetical protein
MTLLFLIMSEEESLLLLLSYSTVCSYDVYTQSYPSINVHTNILNTLYNCGLQCIKRTCNMQVTLTWWRPVFDVACAVNNCIVLPITGWPQTVALLQTVQVPYCHVVSSNVTNLHATNKPTPRSHAQAHRSWKQIQGSRTESHLFCWLDKICREYPSHYCRPFNLPLSHLVKNQD